MVLQVPGQAIQEQRHGRRRADVCPQDGSRLYRGVVINFQPSDSGGLQLLTLSVVKRGTGRGQDFVWLDVPGDELMLLGSCIHSINLTYVDVPGVPTETSFAGFWRRFWLDEP